MNSVPTAPVIPAIATLGPSGVFPARTVSPAAAERRMGRLVGLRLRTALDLGAA